MQALPDIMRAVFVRRTKRKLGEGASEERKKEREGGRSKRPSACPYISIYKGPYKAYCPYLVV
jgi:hypothetical protein